MEHEVLVPVPAEALRAVLTDPDRVARCVPGLQRDAAGADAGEDLAGRLRLRVGGHTITYRGGLRIVERDGAITYEGEGTEARGKGVVEVSLTVVLTPAAEGTGLSFTGALTATGRLPDEPEEARETARARLLDAFVEAAAGLAAETAEETAGDGTDAGAGAGGAEAPDADGTGGAEGVDGTDPFVDEVFPEVPGPVELPSPQPAAEAAHARRTMIGRSAEEVDHAPPRGRYAPVPAPEPGGAGATLRWVAPAAALALASAVIVTRALRRRR
ncbi:CoxG family protein [Streptomyces griseus]|uniref:CoxG family protein n=1 Tax=Streptomyces griseus TaxID=1911 RepID=UPI0004C94137|nr:SRPBCC family protein [Streptomyces griseus]